MLKDFEGIQYRLCDNWFNFVDVNKFRNRSINYLEIGTLCGANLLAVCSTYGLHKDSKLHCIDPWENYDEYDEYKTRQDSNYRLFLNNVEKSGSKDKIFIHKGYSHTEVPKLDDNYFDIIYIDGNHEPEYVLEDAVLSFRKLKRGGYLIFDDYGWNGPDMTKRGIDAFISGYHKRIAVLGMSKSQVFLAKRN